MPSKNFNERQEAIRSAVFERLIVPLQVSFTREAQSDCATQQVAQKCCRRETCIFERVGEESWKRALRDYCFT